MTDSELFPEFKRTADESVRTGDCCVCAKNQGEYFTPDGLWCGECRDRWA